MDSAFSFLIEFFHPQIKLDIIILSRYIEIMKESHFPIEYRFWLVGAVLFISSGLLTGIFNQPWFLLINLVACAEFLSFALFGHAVPFIALGKKGFSFFEVKLQPSPHVIFHGFTIERLVFLKCGLIGSIAGIAVLLGYIWATWFIVLAGIISAVFALFWRPLAGMFTKMFGLKSILDTTYDRQ
jgi:hypothetical protein